MVLKVPGLFGSRIVVTIHWLRQQKDAVLFMKVSASSTLVQRSTEVQRVDSHHTLTHGLSEVRMQVLLYVQLRLLLILEQEPITMFVLHPLIGL